MNDWKIIAATITGFDLPEERLAAKIENLGALRPLPAHAIRKIREAIAMEWTYHSNAIEGNTLTLSETRAVIEEGITVKGKSLREHLEAVNHHEALERVLDLAKPGLQLSEKLIRTLHEMMLQKIEREWAGRYRPVGVRITGANFVPPNLLKVPDLMADLINWTLENPLNLPPIWLATIFHHRFVWIHPFIDGNGRTVRLAYNLLLMSLGYPPAIILKQDRLKYYNALDEANEGKLFSLALLMLQACERSTDIYLSNLQGTAGDYKPISDIVSEEDFPYGEEYLSLLARRGKIDAYKEGKLWFTSREAVENYRAGRKRKRL